MVNKQNKKKNGQLTVHKRNESSNTKAVTKYVQETPAKTKKSKFDWKSFLIFAGVGLLCLIYVVLPDPFPVVFDDAIVGVGGILSGITAIALPLISLFFKKN